MTSNVASEVKESITEASSIQPRAKVSAFVICKNEEDHIKQCLESLSFCDEVIVVDSYSTDSTVEKAKSLGARVVQREWPGYKAQKEFGLSITANEWVINLDADERVSDELRQSILNVLENDASGSKNSHSEEIVGYYINRVVYYLGRWWRKGGWYREYRLRFFKKSKVTWGGVDPHEKPIPDGKTSRLVGELYHYTYRDLDDQIERLQQHATMAALEEVKKGSRWTVSKLIVNPVWRMIKFYIVKKGYREGVAGLIVAIAEANYTFLKYAKVWELTQIKANEENSEKTDFDANVKR